MIEIFLAPICPFAHRAWLALELLGLPYTQIEVDLNAKSPEFIAAYPKAVGTSSAPGAPAKVPVIRDAAFPQGLAESAVITAYLVDTAAAAAGDGDAGGGAFLLRPTPAARARAQLLVEQVGGAIIKQFYALLFAQEPAAQAAASAELLAACAALGEAAAGAGGDGPFLLGARPSLALPVAGALWRAVRVARLCRAARGARVRALPRLGGRHGCAARRRRDDARRRVLRRWLRAVRDGRQEAMTGRGTHEGKEPRAECGRGWALACVGARGSGVRVGVRVRTCAPRRCVRAAPVTRHYRCGACA